jgi:hypothetical protein
MIMGGIFNIVKIFHRTIRNGKATRFVNSFTEAAMILKNLCEQQLPAVIWDEEFLHEVRGGVWEDDSGQWRWFSK